MNHLFFYGLLTFVGVFMISSGATAKEKNDGNYHPKQILMLGLADNVKSNYFYKGLITEETGIREDAIDMTYNAILMENIGAMSKEEWVFIPAIQTQDNIKWADRIKTDGDDEACYSDMSDIPLAEFQETLNGTGAEYLLVLNRHYLKWQETPLRTVFHIVSYTLFDKDKKELHRGNHYFTSMQLEQPEKLKVISRKSAARIAATVINQLK